MNRPESYDDKDQARAWGVTLTMTEVLELMELIYAERKMIRSLMQRGMKRTAIPMIGCAQRIIYYEAAVVAWAVTGLGLVDKRVLDSQATEFRLPVGIYPRRGA